MLRRGPIDPSITAKPAVCGSDGVRILEVFVSSSEDMTRLHRPLTRRVLGYGFQADLSLLSLVTSIGMLTAGFRDPSAFLALWPFLVATVSLIYLNIQSGIFVNERMIRFRGIANRRFLWSDVTGIECAGGRAFLILRSGERYAMPGTPQIDFAVGEFYDPWKPAQQTVSVVVAAAPNEVPLCFSGSDPDVPPLGIPRCGD